MRIPHVFLGWFLVGLVVTAPSLQAAPKAAKTKPRALRCYEIGRLYGSAFVALDARARARGQVFENYCAEKRDPSLGRVPTDKDVDTLVAQVANAARGKVAAPFVNTGPLDEQIRTGNDAEKQLLDSLLQ